MRYTFLILSFAFVFSCDFVKDNNEKVVETENRIKINTDPSILDFEEVFEWDNFIFFNDKNILSSIYQVKHLNDSIFVFSFEDDQNGLLIKNIHSDEEIYINKYGPGPGEFTSISNYSFSRNNETIFILDEPSEKIIQYNLQGKFINEYRNSNIISTQSFTHLGNNEFLIYGGNNYFGLHDFKVVRIDLKKDEIIDKFLPINETVAKYLFVIESENFTNNKYFHSSYDEIIYRLEDKNLKPFYKLDFGEKQLPRELLDRDYANILEFNQYLNNLDYAHGVSNLTINKNLTFFTYTHKGELKFFLENKGSGISRSYNKIETLFLNEKSKIGYEHIPLGIYNSSLHIVVEPYELFNFLEKSKSVMSEKNLKEFQEKYKQWFDLSNKITKKSNPFIVSYKLKE